METKKSLRILVLGGRGFVGKNLVTALQKTRHTIFTTSRAEGVDLTNYDSVVQYFKKINPDVILNCAAHVGSLHYVTANAATVLHDNIQMSLNLYRAVAEACPQAKIVNLLSNCSYPGAADIQVEADWWNGPVHDSVFSYGNAKRTLYVIAKCYERQHQIKTINFLIPNTFGPGDTTDPNKTHALNGMIIRMLEAQRRGENIFEIWGTGSPIREWAYIDDVVKILMEGVEMEQNLIEPVNLAQNKGYTIRESAEYIAKALDFSGELTFNTSYKDGAPIKILDDRKFRAIFPDFAFSDHKKGIAETVAYYKSTLPPTT